MSQTILRSEVMREINKGLPFNSLEFVTADRRRGTGGELIHVRNWMKFDASSAGNSTVHKHLADTEENKRDPNHIANKTFNIYNPRNRQQHILKVHYRLMLTFNGKMILNG